MASSSGGNLETGGGGAFSFSSSEIISRCREAVFLNDTVEFHWSLARILLPVCVLTLRMNACCVEWEACLEGYNVTQRPWCVCERGESGNQESEDAC